MSLHKNKYCGGVHLTSRNITCDNINEIPPHYITIGSCHNIKEIIICNKNKFKFIVISPVLDSGKKNGIGWENFEELSAKSNIPVFALGGMDYKRDINTVKNHGGTGIASISYFYNLF